MKDEMRALAFIKQRLEENCFVLMEPLIALSTNISHYKEYNVIMLDIIKITSRQDGTEYVLSTEA